MGAPGHASRPWTDRLSGRQTVRHLSCYDNQLAGAPVGFNQNAHVVCSLFTHVAARLSALERQVSEASNRIRTVVRRSNHLVHVAW